MSILSSGRTLWNVRLHSTIECFVHRKEVYTREVPSSDLTSTELIKRSWIVILQMWPSIMFGLVGFSIIHIVILIIFTTAVEQRLQIIMPVLYEKSSDGEQRDIVDQLYLQLDQAMLASGDFNALEGVSGGLQLDQMFDVLLMLVQLVIPFSIGILCASILASFYFLIIAAQHERNPLIVCWHLVLSALPLFAMSFWAGVRSFMWIPVIGPFIMLALFPRLILAPYIYLAGESGPIHSISESFWYTQGKWWLISSVLSVFSVYCAIGSLVAGFVINEALSIIHIPEYLSGLAPMVIYVIGLAWFTLCYAELCRALEEDHPLPSRQNG